MCRTQRKWLSQTETQLQNGSELATLLTTPCRLHCCYILEVGSNGLKQVVSRPAYNKNLARAHTLCSCFGSDMNDGVGLNSSSAAKANGGIGQLWVLSPGEPLGKCKSIWAQMHAGGSQEPCGPGERMRMLTFSSKSLIPCTPLLLFPAALDSL